LETLLPGGAHLNSRHLLRLNVGFLLNKNVGYSRDFVFEHDSVQVGDDLEVSNLRGTVQLTCTSQGVYAQGHFETQVCLDCVRCLKSFDQELSVGLKALFIYPPNRAIDPLLAIDESGMLDLNPLLRECLLLEIPIQPRCQQECKGLCPVCGGNLNDSICEHPRTDIDPRLAELKTLLTKS
jgi:uncharacterized protein